MSDSIRSLADLRPGDLMFTNIGGLVPGVFPVKLGQLMLGERVRLGRASIDHVGVVTRRPNVLLDGPESWRGAYTTLVQAMPSGAEEIQIREQTHWTPGTVYMRLTEDYPGQAQDAAAIAQLFVSQKIPYSFASYAALAAWHWGLKAERLERWIDRRRDPVSVTMPSSRTPFISEGPRLPAEAICSVLADQAWTLAGKQVMPRGTRSQIVTPGALFLALWRSLGVITGGAGLLESS